MTVFAALLIAVTSPASATVPVSSAHEVVSAARLCFEAIAAPTLNQQVITKAGWTEHLVNGRRTPGGISYEKAGGNVRLAIIGTSCSLVAAVKAPAEVEQVLLQLDDVVGPDGIAETEQGIRLTKGKRIVDFLVGPSSHQTPSGIRIDFRHSEAR